MKKKTLWILVIISLISLSSLPAISFASEEMSDMHSVAVGNVKVELMTEPGIPQVGENQITVHLTDSSSGKTINNAVVKITAAMDEQSSTMENMDMSNKQQMNIDLAADTGDPGSYTGTIKFSDPGTWNIKVDFNANGAGNNVEFNTEVKSGGPNLTVIGTFIGVILLVIIVAAVAKKRKTIIAIEDGVN